MFGLKVSDNIDRTPYQRGPKACYSADIVYGECSQFQFDFLFDEFGGLGTLNGRKDAICIVDEVDSMLLDDCSKMARLSHTVAGMDLLIPIYYLVYDKCLNLLSNCVFIKDKIYYVNGKLDCSSGTPKVQFMNPDGTLTPKWDLESHIRLNKNDPRIVEVKNEQEFVKESLEEYINHLLFDEKEKKIFLPSNLQQYAKMQTKIWIENMLVSLSYQQDGEYIIHEGLIKPVDFARTGVILNSTSWSDGLHQFLQCSNALKLMPECLTTNYISNFAFFRRYGGNLIGVTGTLGSPKAREFLSSLYHTDSVIIPELRKKQYIQFPTVVASRDTEWIQYIVNLSKVEIKKRRGVLIICEKIEQAQTIAEKLTKIQKAQAIKLYTTNNDSQQESKIETIHPGEIIVATNLAGRGTDIKTSEIEKYGGLHVILTFLPENTRIQEQAFGRTSRQGKKGTGQLILNAKSLLDYGTYTIDNLEQVRDQNECKTIEHFEKNEKERIEIREELFKRFCSFLKKIRDTLPRPTIIDHIKEKLKEKMDYEYNPRVFEMSVIAAIEERWGYLLKQIEINKLSKDEAIKEYEQFESSIDMKDLTKNIQNPFYNILIGFDYLLNDEYACALEYFERVIKAEKDSCPAAYFGRAWCYLKNSNYKTEVISELDKAVQLINHEKGINEGILTMFHQKHGDIQSNFAKQLLEKNSLLGSFSNSLCKMIFVIRASLRMFDISGYNTKNDESVIYFENVKGLTNIYKIIDSLSAKKCDMFDIFFNDLIRKGNNENSDQAIQTIKSFVDMFKNEDLSNTISLQLNTQPAQEMHSLFHPHIELKGLSKESAISQLEEKDSIFHKFIPDFIWKECMLNLVIQNCQEKIERKNVKIKQALNTIKGVQNEDALYNITLINQNKKALEFENLLPSKSNFIDIEFQGATSEFIDLISEKSLINLEIKSSDPMLEKICSEEKNVQLCIRNGKMETRAPYTKESFSKAENPKTVRIWRIKPERAKQIILSLQGNFNIQVKDLNLTTSKYLLEKFTGNVKLGFSKIGNKLYKDLINFLRDARLDFVLAFSNLQKNQLEYLTESASLDQQEIKISKLSNLSDLYLHNQKPVQELQELSLRGINNLIEINEQRFIPWRAILGVTALAALQMTGGIILICSGYGATVGMGLVTEGAADLVTAGRTLYSREFSWQDYCTQKAISLIISATSMGWQALKNAGKGIEVLAKRAIAGEVLEQGCTELVKNGKAVTEIAKQSYSKLFKLAFKQTMVATGEACVKETLNAAAGFITNLGLDIFKPMIASSIQEKVDGKFRSSDLGSILKKIAAIEKYNKQTSLNDHLNKIVLTILNPEHPAFIKYWNSIALPLCKGILSSSQLLNTDLSLGIRISGTLKGFRELCNIVDNVYLQIRKKILHYHNDYLSISLLLQQYCNLKEKTAKEVTKILKKHSIIDEDDLLICGSNLRGILFNIDFEEANPSKEGIIIFLETIEKCISNGTDYDMSMVVKTVADHLTNQVIRIIDSQLISPWSSFYMGKLTTYLSEQFQDKFIVNEEDNTDQLNQTEERRKELEKKAANKQLTPEEMIIKKPSDKASSNKDFSSVKEIADGVATDAPADLTIMSAMAENLGVKTKIVDDPNYVPTKEDQENGVFVILFTKGEKVDGKDQIGHYQLLGRNDSNQSDSNSSNNDCGFNVFSQIIKEKTGRNVTAQELRAKTAKFIQKNPSSFTTALKSQEWVAKNFPSEANSILLKSGKEKKKNSNSYESKFDPVRTQTNADNLEKTFQDMEERELETIKEIVMKAIATRNWDPEEGPLIFFSREHEWDVKITKKDLPNGTGYEVTISKNFAYNGQIIYKMSETTEIFHLYSIHDNPKLIEYRLKERYCNSPFHSDDEKETILIRRSENTPGMIKSRESDKGIFNQTKKSSQTQVTDTFQSSEVKETSITNALVYTAESEMRELSTSEIKEDGTIENFNCCFEQSNSDLNLILVKDQRNKERCAEKHQILRDNNTIKEENKVSSKSSQNTTVNLPAELMLCTNIPVGVEMNYKNEKSSEFHVVKDSEGEKILQNDQTDKTQVKVDVELASSGTKFGGSYECDKEDKNGKVTTEHNVGVSAGASGIEGEIEISAKSSEGELSVTGSKQE